MTDSARATIPHLPGADEARGVAARAASPLARALRVLAVIRRVMGVPDYDQYVWHMAAKHPGQPVLTEREFAEEQLRNKYSRPGHRCC